MKTRACLIMASLFLIPALLGAEVTMKVTGARQLTFYQDGKEVAKQVVDERMKAAKTDGAVPDGMVKGYFPSGKLQVEVIYKKNAKEGVLKAYYENGKLQEETYFKNDLREGPSKIYFVNGKLAQDVAYKSGKLSGICKTFFESGKLRQEANYIEGDPEGSAKKYFEDGQLQEDMTYLKGNLIKSKKYNIKGELIYEKGAAGEQQK